MNIRAATPSDASAIASLMLLAMREITYEIIGRADDTEALRFLAHFIALRENQYAHENIFVAEEDGQIIGEICLYPGADLEKLRHPITAFVRSNYDRAYPESRETQAGEVYLDTLAVAPAAQGKGIGKKLLEFAIRQVVHEQGQPLGLLVERQNPHAKRLYEKVGFQTIHTVHIFNKAMDHMQYLPTGQQEPTAREAPTANGL